MMPTYRTRIQAIVVFALLMMGACVEPYPPPPSAGSINLFVVDGFINASSKTVNVKLSRAIALAETTANPPEENANVTVEDDGGGSISLEEVQKGIYQASELTLDDSKNYRLRIETNDGKSYSSGYVKLRSAAMIDSISWRPMMQGGVENWGVQFYVSGHDPNNATRFYRYLFTETWEHNVDLFSEYTKDEKKKPIPRPPSQQVFLCWKNAVSTNVLTASTKQLSSDIVTMSPIRFIKKGTEQISRIYSINVQQMGISEEEFEFRELIKKTSENLGGLFDPLPSQVVGNVRNNNNPDEQVLGYFGGGYVTEKRFFLRHEQLPQPFRAGNDDGIICEQRLVNANNIYQVTDGEVYISGVGSPPTAYYVASRFCGDCTSQGGSNIRPSFWPAF